MSEKQSKSIFVMNIMPVNANYILLPVMLPKIICWDLHLV